MKKAQFKIGQHAKYTGNSSAKMKNAEGELLPWIFPGMVVRITETQEPREPLGQVTPEIYDEGQDGYNIGVNEHGLGIVIWPGSEWGPTT